MKSVLDRVSGGLGGSLLGDALGCVTEMLTPRQIRDRYGCVDSLLNPATGTFADGRVAGELTDDGLLTLSVLRKLAGQSGAITPEDVADLLLSWAADPELLSRFAGPSSRKAILALLDGATPADAGAPDPMDNDLRSSNGAAMKVAPAGWAAPGDIERAAELAAHICVPTHNTNVAYAGAAAAAGAVSTAVVATTAVQVGAGAIAGAKAGERLARHSAIEVPGPSIPARLELAVELATGPEDTAVRVQRLADIFGSGLPIAEAVPMALGLFLVFPNDPRELLITTVNLGGDADTVAAIAGAIGGTYCGFDALPADWLATVEAVNSISVRAEAAALLDAIAQGKSQNE